MKKTIALMLVFALGLSLCGCTALEKAKAIKDVILEEIREDAPVATIPKDDLLAEAVEIGDFAAVFSANKLRAEEEYVGNVYYLTGSITAIESDHILLSSIRNDAMGLGSAMVMMPAEELIALTTGQRITVVGKVDAFSENDMDLGYGFSQKTYQIHMVSGYMVTDRFELSGKLLFYYMNLLDIDGRQHQNFGDPEYWAFGLDMTDDNVIAVTYSMKNDIPVEHVMGQNLDRVVISGTPLKNGTRITVSARIFGSDLRDVELVSIDG